MVTPDDDLAQQYALLDAFLAEVEPDTRPTALTVLALDADATPTERILSALTIARTQVDALLAGPPDAPDVAELANRLDQLERTLGEVFAQLAELRESLPAPANPN